MKHPFTLDKLFTEETSVSRSFKDLHSYPDVSGDALKHHGCIIGAAGELFFDSFMARHGFLTASSPGSPHADRLLLFPSATVKIQVKTKTKPTGSSYAFTMAKGYGHSPAGRRSYETDDYDIAALVILPLNFVYFTADRGTSQTVRFDQIRRLQDRPLESLTIALRDFLHPELAPQQPLPGL